MRFVGRPVGGWDQERNCGVRGGEGRLLVVGGVFCLDHDKIGDRTGLVLGQAGIRGGENFDLGVRADLQ